MRTVLLAVLALSGCERADGVTNDCSAAAKVIVDVFQAPDAKPPADSKDRVTARCTDDHWSAPAIHCIQHEETRPGIVRCHYKHLTQEQADLLRPVLESIDPVADEAVRMMRSYWDRACACTSQDCAAAVVKEMGSWGNDLRRRGVEPARITGAKREQLKAISEQIGKCVQRALESKP